MIFMSGDAGTRRRAAPTGLLPLLFFLPARRPARAPGRVVGTYLCVGDLHVHGREVCACAGRTSVRSSRRGQWQWPPQLHITAISWCLVSYSGMSSKTKQLYLIAYNALCCLGWAYVLALGIPSAIASVTSSLEGGSSLLDAVKAAGANVYFATPSTAGWSNESSPSLAFVLTVVQSAALLEVLHSAMGLVRSPVFVTTLQVGSRIVALHMVNASPRAQSKSVCCNDEDSVRFDWLALMYCLRRPMGSRTHDFQLGIG